MKTDSDLEIEDLKTYCWVLLTLLAIVSGVLLTRELNRGENCTPDLCYDDFCVILKGEK